MGLIDSPACKCGFVSQDINHLFWACPFLVNKRQKLYKSLRQYNLQDPFSIEYLIGNIGKKIASLICNFILKIEKTLNIKL